MTLRLVLVGPPGAGKGTQAAKIAAQYGVPAISTGDIFRSHIKAGTALGARAKELIEHGDFVPDELTNEMVAQRLAEPDAAEGFLLDGYPRNLNQVHALEKMLADKGKNLHMVLEIAVPREEVIDRLLKRAAREGRADDTREVIDHRMDVYKQKTEVLSQYYGSRGLLESVSGLGNIDEVSGRCLEAIAARLAK